MTSSSIGAEIHEMKAPTTRTPAALSMATSTAAAGRGDLEPHARVVQSNHGIIGSRYIQFDTSCCTTSSSYNQQGCRSEVMQWSRECRRLAEFASRSAQRICSCSSSNARKAEAAGAGDERGTRNEDARDVEEEEELEGRRRDKAAELSDSNSRRGVVADGARDPDNDGKSSSVISCGSSSDEEGRPLVLEVLSQFLERIVEFEESKCTVGSRSASGVASYGGDRTDVEAEEEAVTVFHGQRAPGISVDKYVERIFRYARCSPACFVVALAYLERLQLHTDGSCNALHPFIVSVPLPQHDHHKRSPYPYPLRRRHIPITSLTVHRLLITSVMLAAKYLDDSYFNNAYYAKVGGVSTLEMNRLELELLFRLGFRLHVTVETFDMYCARLSSRGNARISSVSCCWHDCVRDPQSSNLSNEQGEAEV